MTSDGVLNDNKLYYLPLRVHMMNPTKTCDFIICTRV